jgi:gliding motility-associated-like protein
MLMRLLNCGFLLMLLWLAGAGTARAQSCVTVNPPACTFEAIDDNGLSVAALCVGKRVKLQPCAGRDARIYNNNIYYGVLPGVGTTFPACTPTNIHPYYYTPTLADVGMITISELSNEAGFSKYYIRTFRVYDTTPPPFTIAPCPTGSALVTVTDTKFDSYQVRVGSGPSQAIGRNQPTVLALPASATITVTGRYAIAEACEGVSTQTIRAAAAPVTPGFVSLTLLGPLPGGAATLAVSQLPADYQYTLQVADGAAPGGFRNVQPVAPGSTSISLPSPAAGCYRIARTDACGTSPDASPLICTLGLSGTSARNRNQLLLADAGANGFGAYSVTRNGQPITTLTAIAGGLEDADVQCGSTYTYVVTAKQPGGGVAVSNPVSITTVSALPPQQPKLVASFNLRNVVELAPLLAPPALPAGSSLRYFRTAGATTADFGTVSTLRAPRDSSGLDALRAALPCYNVRLLDVCGNASPLSAPACPSLLSATAAGPDGSAAELTWTPFSGPDPSQPAVYALQRLTADGTVRSTLPVSGNTYADLATPADQTIRYRLQISGAGLPAGTFSYSNLASVTRTPTLTIPTAFTPNSDGLNDVLEVKGRYLGSYTFVVVDRNGQEVFRGTQRSDVWDGRIAGRAPVPGQPFVRSGAVTILK